MVITGREWVGRCCFGFPTRAPCPLLQVHAHLMYHSCTSSQQTRLELPGISSAAQDTIYSPLVLDQASGPRRQSSASPPDSRLTSLGLTMSTYSASLDNHKADTYAANAAFVYSAKYTAPVLALLNAKPGERIADFGCGTGQLTQEIADTVGSAGHVMGIDSSENMASELYHALSSQLKGAARQGKVSGSGANCLSPRRSSRLEVRA